MLSREIIANRRYIFNARTYIKCSSCSGHAVAVSPYEFLSCIAHNEFKCCLSRTGKKLSVRRRKSSDPSGRAPNAGIVLRVGIPGDISRCDITLEPGIVEKLSILYISRDLLASATITLRVNTVSILKNVKIAQNLKVVTSKKLYHLYNR